MKARHGVTDVIQSHISFIDHHSCPPTHFPNLHVPDAPDIIGVRDGPTKYPVRRPKTHHSDAPGPEYEGVPHHRIDTVVEAKPVGSDAAGKLRPQGAAYAYRHLQARPDHPTFLLLLVTPRFYQVLLSNANGVIASERTSWDDTLQLLQAYLYSLYIPPDNHVLFDPTMFWDTTRTGEDSVPEWTIKFHAGQPDEQTFKYASLYFYGSPWSRRTAIFKCVQEDGEEVIIKEYYRSARRRFKEEDVLRHIHADGDVPGIVRLRCAEEVVVDGKVLQIGSEEGKDLRTKVRLVLYDSGEPLEAAKSVNDLLRCFYDAIEGAVLRHVLFIYLLTPAKVHRILLVERRVLHRDMSKFNILIYPRWSTKTGSKVMEGAPPLIDDILADEPR